MRSAYTQCAGIIAGLLIALLVAGAASAAPSVAVDLDVSTPGVQSTFSIAEGDPITVAVVAQDVTDLRGYQAGLTFDPAVLSATKDDMADGGYLESAGGDDAGMFDALKSVTGGTALGAQILLFDPGQENAAECPDGEGELWRVTFQTSGTGITQLGLTDTGGQETLLLGPVTIDSNQPDLQGATLTIRGKGLNPGAEFVDWTHMRVTFNVPADLSAATFTATDAASNPLAVIGFVQEDPQTVLLETAVQEWDTDYIVKVSGAKEQGTGDPIGGAGADEADWSTPCKVGDLDGDCSVSRDEVINCLWIYLTLNPYDPAADDDRNGVVERDDVINALWNYLFPTGGPKGPSGAMFVSRTGTRAARVVTFSTSSDALQPGQPANVGIDIDEGDGIDAGGLWFTFDPGVIASPNATTGPLMTSGTVFTQVVGNECRVAILPGATVGAGSGRLVNVEFTADAGVTPDSFSDLIWSQLALKNAAQEDIPATGENGRIPAPLAPPENLAVNDKAGDQGGVIEGTFDKSPDDDGAGGIDEYHVYKEEQTGLGTKAFAQFLTIPADGSAQYAFEDPAASKVNDTCYRVTSVLGGGESAPSNTDCAKGEDNTAPGAPTNVVATDKPADQGKNALVDFDASADDGGGANDVSEYRVYRDGDPTPVGTVTADGSGHYQYEDTVPTVGQEYCYIVRAFDGENESADSNEDCATTVDDTPPGAPQNVDAQDHPNDQGDALDVTWDASPDDGAGADDVVRYGVYREEQGGDGYHWLAYEPATDAPNYLFHDTTVTKGTEYCYMVRALDGHQQSVYSNEDCATPVDNTAPAPPSNVDAHDDPTPDQGGVVEVTFDKSSDDGANANDVVRYHIYRDGADVGQVAADGSASYSYTDNVGDKNEHFYQVTADDDTQESDKEPADPGDPGTGIDNIAPDPPTNVQANDVPGDQGKSILVTWDPSPNDPNAAAAKNGVVKDVVSYQVYRGGVAVGGPVAAGTYQYQDDDVPDQFNEYCYTVRANDGTNESADSAENGNCATATDDTPPGPPQNVNASDHPADQGDALDVTWDRSADDGQGADDVTEYRVYRDGDPAPVHTEAATGAASYAWTDTGRTKGQEYCYIVRAFDATQESGDSNQSCATPVDNTPPGPPSNVDAHDDPTPDQGGVVEVTFDKSSDDGGNANDVVRYHIYRDGADVGQVAADGSASYSYTDNVGDKNEHFYQVTADDDTQESDKEPADPGDPGTGIDNIAPDPPTNVGAADVPGDQGESILVTWDPSPNDPNAVAAKNGVVQDVQFYQVYREGVPVGEPVAIIQGTKRGGQYQYQDDEVPDQFNEYCYTVRANDGTNEGLDSDPPACAIGDDDTPPGAPQNVDAEDTDNDQGGSITVTWGASADDGGGANDVTQYQVYREQQGGATTKAYTSIGAPVAATGAATYLFEDTTATTGTEYCYLVRAFDGTQESANSNTDCATSAPNVPADPPHNLAAADTPNDEGGSVSLTWDRSGDDGIGGNSVTEYRVYRKSGGGGYAQVATIPATDQASYTYDDTGLTDGVAYTYEVRSWNDSAEAASNEATATPLDNLPPAPPLNVTATDVAPDQGGSILVTWEPSPNDPNAVILGAKANGDPLDVTSYQVYRDGAPVGEPVPIATATKPIAIHVYEFTDDAVPDTTEEHCYIVRANDPTHESGDSNESCATAADNLPPGAPQNLRAGDLSRAAGDRRIALKWDRSADDGQGANDVTEYHVYREQQGGVGTKAFAQVMTVTATGAATYNVHDTDAALAAGAQYSYLVRAFDGTNESADSNQYGPATPAETPQFAHSFAAGLQLVTIPATPVGPNLDLLKVTDIYQVPDDNTHVWRWDPLNSPPWVTDPTNAFMDVAQGRGHWIRFEQPTTVTLNGMATPDDQQFVWDEIQEGWNMSGNPRTVTLDWLEVEPNPVGSADNFGWIYDAAAGTYRLVADFVAINAVTQVPPYAGFWIRGHANADKLEFADVGTVATKGRGLASLSRKTPAPRWQLPVVVSGGGVRDLCNAVGVADEPVMVADPPCAARYVDAYILSDAAPGERLAYDLRADGATSWQMGVGTNLADTDITITFPDLGQVPKDCDVILRDLDTQQVVHVRTQQTYTYNSGRQAGERRFSLEVVPRTEGALAINAVQVVPTRGGAVSLRYDITQAASVTTTVVNIAGRVVAVVQRDQAVARGPVVTTWDLRNNGGMRVPDGAYLVRVEARSGDGQRTSAVTSIHISR